MSVTDSAGGTDDARVFYRDVVPYYAPLRLEDLIGPAEGELRLPRWVYWGPQSVFDLSKAGHVQTAYQALVRVGAVEDQVQFLNQAVLVAVWPRLVLPVRCRQLWEERFPQLREELVQA